MSIVLYRQPYDNTFKLTSTIHVNSPNPSSDAVHIIQKASMDPHLGEVLALRAHCVHSAHAEAGILTQVIRLVVTILFPRNPFQKNEQFKNI